MKKQLIKHIAFLSLVALPITTWVQQSESKTQSPVIQSPVKLTDLNSPILVKKSEPTITLTLEANPTTGYSWYLLHYDHRLLAPLSAKFYPPQRKIMGAPGHMVWKFQVKDSAFNVPRITKIKMIYARPWKIANEKPTKVAVVIQ